MDTQKICNTDYFMGGQVIEPWYNDRNEKPNVTLPGDVGEKQPGFR